MIHIVLLRIAQDSTSNPNLNRPSAPQASSFAFVSTFRLQNPILQTSNLQLLRIKLHYGTLVLAMLQPLAYHISPKLQPYQITSEQPYLAPIQIQASANPALKRSRHGYRTLRQRGGSYLH